jgi:DNA gyrase inhibitor GyrI
VEAGIQAGKPAETVVEKLKTDTATNSTTRPALDQTATLLRITGGQAGFLKLVKRT